MAKKTAKKETPIPPNGRLVINAPADSVTVEATRLEIARALLALAKSLESQPSITVSGCHLRTEGSVPALAINGNVQA